MIAGLVLAAGVSRRFGRRNKLLTSVHGYPVIAHVLTTLARAPIRPIIVVTGPDHARIACVCRHTLPRYRRARLIRNRTYGSGMGSSLRTGLRALPHHCTGVLICLGDMPAIDIRLVHRVLGAWRPTLDYVRPVRAGQPGHPVLISARLFSALGGLEGDQGAQSVLARVTPERRRLICGTGGCLRDLDTPRMLRAWSVHRYKRKRGSRPYSHDPS